jgi:hypothetical protein
MHKVASTKCVPTNCEKKNSRTDEGDGRRGASPSVRASVSHYSPCHTRQDRCSTRSRRVAISRLRLGEIGGVSRAMFRSHPTAIALGRWPGYSHRQQFVPRLGHTMSFACPITQHLANYPPQQSLSLPMEPLDSSCDLKNE